MTWFRRRLDYNTKHQPPCDQSNGGQHLWSRDNHFLTNDTKYPNKNWLFNRLNNYFVYSLLREDKKDWKVHYSQEIHWMDCVFSVTLIHKIRCMMNFFKPVFWWFSLHTRFSVHGLTGIQHSIYKYYLLRIMTKISNTKFNNAALGKKSRKVSGHIRTVVLFLICASIAVVRIIISPSHWHHSGRNTHRHEFLEEQFAGVRHAHLWYLERR